MPADTTAAAASLIDAAALRQRLDEGAPGAVVVVDCGFDLTDADAGARAHAAGHLPGAVYAHLDRDLSGPRSGRNGRHPLPGRDTFARTVGGWGVRPDTFVVCGDDQGGPYAARAWWLLRWLGHREVAVLDGGFAAWRAAGGGWTGAPTTPRAAVAPYPAAAEPAMPTVDAATLLARVQAAQGRLLDARAPERFRGEVEPLDAVAGHIPGAANRFFKDNLQPDGRFKPADELRRAFDALGAGGLPPHAVVQQCGSGVTACHNLLAMVHAGLGETVLYPGSWSEWCSDPSRPVVRAAGAAPLHPGR